MTPHFSKDELACKCCGHAPMSAEFMNILEKVRVQYGKPMPVSSGYRCPKHNQSVSNSGPNGPHTTGRAVDILVSGGNAMELLRVILAHGSKWGLGIQQKGDVRARFIHIDNIRKRMWSY